MLKKYGKNDKDKWNMTLLKTYFTTDQLNLLLKEKVGIAHGAKNIEGGMEIASYFSIQKITGSNPFNQAKAQGATPRKEYQL